MVIQRWQSVYLLLAVFAMVLAIIRPFGVVITNDGETIQLVSMNFPIYFIVNTLIGMLLLIDIFLYKNLKYQRLVAAVCILLILASAITAVIIMTGTSDIWSVEWTGTPVGLACALICTLFARYRMGQDEKLLKSYDRIR